MVDNNGALEYVTDVDMDMFDKMCLTVSSAGGRRSAQMGTMDVQHPALDIKKVACFIKAYTGLLEQIESASNRYDSTEDDSSDRSLSHEQFRVVKDKLIVLLCDTQIDIRENGDFGIRKSHIERMRYLIEVDFSEPGGFSSLDKLRFNAPVDKIKKSMKKSMNLEPEGMTS